jgi:uncharacterized membrane protein
MQARTLPPAQLSRELRLGKSPDLARRRWAIGLSFAGCAIGAVVAAYQTGMIKRLPDIAPGSIWDAERVDASDYAYARLQTPDATLMIVTYGITAALVAAGGKARARDNPAIPLAAAAKAIYDLVTCVRLGREEWATNRALCSWCQLATLISAATVALTLPEATMAVRAVSRER